MPGDVGDSAVEVAVPGISDLLLVIDYQLWDAIQVLIAEAVATSGCLAGEWRRAIPRRAERVATMSNIVSRLYAVPLASSALLDRLMRPLPSAYWRAAPVTAF